VPAFYGVEHASETGVVIENRRWPVYDGGLGIVSALQRDPELNIADAVRAAVKMGRIEERVIVVLECGKTWVGGTVG